MFITGIFKPQLFSSHATCRLTRLTEFILNSHEHGKQSNECIKRKISLPSWNLFKRQQVAYNVVVVSFLLVYPLFFTLHFVVACLLLNSLFKLMLLLYFCLFVDHVNKSLIFVIGACVYDFKNTISIFVTVSKKYFLK